jgi:ubiquitin carboxyl-terminal hydrolase 5/13
LKAVVIHLGKTPTHGHYVAYVKKEGEWVLFNDNAVKIPKEPVLGKGYIYLYESV